MSSLTSEEALEFILTATTGGEPKTITYTSEDGTNQTMTADGKPPADIGEYAQIMGLLQDKVIPSVLAGLEATGMTEMSPELQIADKMIRGFMAAWDGAPVAEIAQDIAQSVGAEVGGQPFDGPMNMVAAQIGEALKSLVPQGNLKDLPEGQQLGDLAASATPGMDQIVKGGQSLG